MAGKVCTSRLLAGRAQGLQGLRAGCGGRKGAVSREHRCGILHRSGWISIDTEFYNAYRAGVKSRALPSDYFLDFYELLAVDDDASPTDIKDGKHFPDLRFFT